MIRLMSPGPCHSLAGPHAIGQVFGRRKAFVKSGDPLLRHKPRSTALIARPFSARGGDHWLSESVHRVPTGRAQGLGGAHLVRRHPGRAIVQALDVAMGQVRKSVCGASANDRSWRSAAPLPASQSLLMCTEGRFLTHSGGWQRLHLGGDDRFQMQRSVRYCRQSSALPRRSSVVSTESVVRVALGQDFNDVRRAS